MSGILYWIVVGLIAGWLAGRVMKGGGYGVVVDIILGIPGGILGGWLFGMRGISAGGGVIGSIVVAFVGAVILVWITRLLKTSLTYGRICTPSGVSRFTPMKQIAPPPGVGGPARFPSEVTQLVARSARVAKYHSAVGARWNFKCSSAASAFFASPDFWRARIRYLIASGECGSAESSSPALE